MESIWSNAAFKPNPTTKVAGMGYCMGANAYALMPRVSVKGNLLKIRQKRCFRKLLTNFALPVDPFKDAKEDQRVKFPHYWSDSKGK